MGRAKNAGEYPNLILLEFSNSQHFVNIVRVLHLPLFVFNISPYNRLVLIIGSFLS